MLKKLLPLGTLLVGGSLLYGCQPVDGRNSGSETHSRAITATKPRPIPPVSPGNGPPPLRGAGAEARTNARAFIGWAGRSLGAEREGARAALQAAAGNSEVVAALADEAFTARNTDHSRSLVALSVLGGMRSMHAKSHLARFLWQPLPTTGTEVEGQIVERAGLEMLEAKAVNGLAYLRTEEGDSEVLRAVAQHPSVSVRAEAIAAYLWNHGETEAARNELKKHLRAGDEIYLERVRRLPGESSASFDKKLQAFLQAHPERVPPAPTRSTPHTTPGPKPRDMVGVPPSRQ